MLEVFRNNLLWLVVGTSLVVVLGLVIAVLADRSRFESLAKAIIFMPMAISFVGAGIIWNFVYDVRAGRRSADRAPQRGGDCLGWPATGLDLAPAALEQPVPDRDHGLAPGRVRDGPVLGRDQGRPRRATEAARVDGATERQVFCRVTMPTIRGTIITVSTTIMILTLKIFDVVIVMTGGQFGTGVIGTEFYRQYFTNRNFGIGSALAVDPAGRGDPGDDLQPAAFRRPGGLRDRPVPRAARGSDRRQHHAHLHLLHLADPDGGLARLVLPPARRHPGRAAGGRSSRTRRGHGLRASRSPPGSTRTA